MVINWRREHNYDERKTRTTSVPSRGMFHARISAQRKRFFFLKQNHVHHRVLFSTSIIHIVHTHTHTHLCSSRGWNRAAWPRSKRSRTFRTPRRRRKAASPANACPVPSRSVPRRRPGACGTRRPARGRTPSRCARSPRPAAGTARRKGCRPPVRCSLSWSPAAVGRWSCFWS